MKKAIVPLCLVTLFVLFGSIAYAEIEKWSCSEDNKYSVKDNTLNRRTERYICLWGCEEGRCTAKLKNPSLEGTISFNKITKDYTFRTGSVKKINAENELRIVKKTQLTTVKKAVPREEWKCEGDYKTYKTKKYYCPHGCSEGTCISPYKSAATNKHIITAKNIDMSAKSWSKIIQDRQES